MLELAMYPIQVAAEWGRCVWSVMLVAPVTSFKTLSDRVIQVADKNGRLIHSARYSHSQGPSCAVIIPAACNIYANVYHYSMICW